MKRILLCLALVVASGGPAFAKPGWTIKQAENTLYVTEKAVKIVNEENQFTLVAQAPDWKVTAFRTDKKLCWQSPLTGFVGIMMLRPLVENTRKRPDGKLIGKETYKGFNCLVYSTAASKLYAAENVKIDPHGAEFLCRYFYTYTVPAVPLFYGTPGSEKKKKYEQKEWFDKSRYNEVSGRTLLSTKSIVAADLKDSVFQVPPGLKRIADIKDISYSDAKRKQFESVIDNFGFMTPDK